MSNAEVIAPAAPAPTTNNTNTANATATATATATPNDANNSSNTPQHPPYATSASLYVGELSPEVTEAMLFELFNQIGPVASIRVCRDAVTRGSLGYAYTNFHNMADAERAMETFNYQPIKGKPCRIMWSQRDPSVRKTGSGNIFIKNLDRTIDNKVLHDTFSAFGNILSCKVATDDSGESRGYGFVHYETGEAAQNAIKHVNGMLLNDRKVFVGQHVPKRERDANSGEVKAKFTNVFVKNLAEEVTEDELRNLFAPYGKITSLAIAANDSDESKPKGFGFLNFEDYASAEKAVEELNDKEIHGKAIFVGRAQKKGEREEELRRHFEQLKLEKMNKFAGINLYVKNLDDTIDDERLRTEFAVFGDITSAKVMKDERGVSKGFGFVCFGVADEANKAVAEMNNKMLVSKPIYVALAQRKDQRKQQLEAQYAQRGASRLMQQPMMPTMPYGPMYYPQGPGGMHMPGAMPPRQGGFMYPPQMQNFRPRFPPGQTAQGQRGAAPMGFQIPGAPYMGGMPQMNQTDQRNHSRNGRGGNNSGSRNAGDMQGSMPPQISAQAMPPNTRGPLPPRGAPYKYSSTVRNVPAGGAATNPAEGEQSLTSILTNLPLVAQKQLLGERLYPAIQTQLGPAKKQLAGKVTGMLLEMDNTELLHLLEDTDALNEKVGEAWEVLERHRKKDEAEKAEL